MVLLRQLKQTTNVAATGAKGLVDVAAGTVTSGVGLLEKGLDAKKKLKDKPAIKLMIQHRAHKAHLMRLTKR